MNEEAAGWTSKNWRIVWSPTNTKTLHYVLAATGFIPGPTHYAAARITDTISSFVLFLTDEIVQHIVAMTNLMGDAQSKPGEIWKCGPSASGMKNQGGAFSGLRCPTRDLITSPGRCLLMTSSPDPDTGKTSWLSSARYGICGRTAW